MKREAALHSSEPVEEDYYYFPTGVSPHELEDSVNYPSQYLMTVTGRVKKRKPRDAFNPGKLVNVNNFKIALFRFKVSKPYDKLTDHC